MTRRFSELRAPQIAEVITPKSILIQPFGAIEQHGPHLPFNTDLVVADALSTAVVERYGNDLDLYLLEPIPYTKSNEHAWSPGSIWMNPSTLLAVIDDLARSLAQLPARKLVFINGHGGNSSLLSVALREVRLHHGLMTFLMHGSVPPDQGGPSTEEEHGMGIHAGLSETSLMLHLRPELVDMTSVRRNIPASLLGNEKVRFGGSVPFGWLSNDFGPHGHIGDPTLASAERGEQQFRAAVEDLGQALVEVARFEFPMEGDA